jgi:hypothetical protein
MLNPNAKPIPEPFPADSKGKRSSRKDFIRQAQDKQDEIFRKMSAEEKLKLTSDFSAFLLKLNRDGKSDGLRRVIRKNRKDS